MGRGTLTVTDSFDSVIGKRRGISPGHERARIQLRQDDMRSALSGPRQITGMWQAQAVFDALHDLSSFAHDEAPEIQAHLRSVIGELIGTSGMGAFAMGWRLNKESLPAAMNDAVSDALVARLQDAETLLYARRLEAKRLVKGLFLDDKALVVMTHPMLEAYSPLVEAVVRAYRAGAGEGEEEEGGEPKQTQDCRGLAICLGICHPELLPLLKSWRDELTREVAVGNCDAILTGLQVALHSSTDTVPGRGMDPERKAFLGPLLDTIEKRRRGE